MGWPVVIAENGIGIAVTESDSAQAIPVEIAENGFGVAVVVVASGGLPVTGLGARIMLSATTVPEDAEVGDLIGTLSVANGSGSYTFTITSDPDSKFAVDGDDLEVAAALDYDTATSHSVTIEADNGVDDPISRTFTISVTEVEAPTISAPLDVTWVDGTNPVECVMNVKWTGTGAVEVGDIPQVRYNGGGTIYDGDAVTVLAGNPTFSGLPTQPSGTGYAQYRFVRDPGGPGEVIGAWSSASEGAFDIASEEFTLEGLFANGEKGALFIPADLSTLFQTEDTSTAVTTDGQPVGRIGDKSGNGNHIVQATSGSRPSYETDGSLHWIEGYSDFLASAASVDLSDGPVLTIILGLADADRGTGAYIQVNDGADALASPGAEILRAFADPSPQVQSTIMGNVGSNSRTGINSLAAGDDWDRFVLTSVYDFSQAAEDEVQEAANGSSLGSATGTNNNTNSSFGTNRVISLFGRNAGELSIYATRCYGALIINRALTPEETTAAEAAIADLAGVTL